MLSLVTACLCAGLLSCGRRSDTETRLREAIHYLDNTFAASASIEQDKEAEMDGLRSRLRVSTDPAVRYMLCDSLFLGYYKRDVDSALHYAHQKEHLAALCNNPDFEIDAALDLAARYNISGLYNNSIEVLQCIDSPRISSPRLLLNYYHTLYNTWHGMLLTTRDEALKAQYGAAEAHYLQASLATADEESIEYYSLYSNIGIREGRLEEVGALLDRRLREPGLALGDYSILHYWKAKVCMEQGDVEQAFLHYVLSADQDMQACIKEGRSLLQVSRLLYRQGDLKRAYQYIERAYADAVHADSRICQKEIAETFPIINTAYKKRERSSRVFLYAALAVLAFLFILTALMLAILQRKQQQVIASNKTIREQVDKLRESNGLKDAYLGRYMALFTEHINSLEKYRSNLRTTAKSLDMQQILAALRSNEFIEAERRTIYKEFDTMFLGVFPDFVQQLNALLEPDKRFREDLPEGTLSNELRVFALIRLGVTDSTAIAAFLRKSLSTVYNYRVKARNAAIGDRSTFESRIMLIDNKL